MKLNTLVNYLYHINVAILEYRDNSVKNNQSLAKIPKVSLQKSSSWLTE